MRYVSFHVTLDERSYVALAIQTELWAVRTTRNIVSGFLMEPGGGGAVVLCAPEDAAQVANVIKLQGGRLPREGVVKVTRKEIGFATNGEADPFSAGGA